MMYKIMTGLAPESLLHLIPDHVEDRTRYQLRNRADIQVPRTRLASYSHSFFPTAVKLWNEFTEIVWDTPDANRHCLDVLEKVQTNAACIVTGATARCSTEKLYTEVGWEKLAL